MDWHLQRMYELARELNYRWGWRSGFIFGFAVGALAIATLVLSIR